MWKQWTIGIVGLAFVLMPFLALTTFVFKFLMTIGGILLAVLGFWILSEERFAKFMREPLSNLPARDRDKAATGSDLRPLV